MAEEIQSIEFDSFPASYYVISRLGFGSFGCAFLTKYRKDMASMVAAEPRKQGTLMYPLVVQQGQKSYSDGLMAVKVMKNRLKRPDDYLRVNEVRFILSVPSHPNLLQIFNVFIDTFSGKLHISMEAMNQNLYQFLEKNKRRPLADSVVKSLLAQLLNAIRHIHSCGYFHRDVKPENILISSSAVYYDTEVSADDQKRDAFVLKLCDYGLARHIDNKRDLTQYVSTRWYRAPEILLRLRNYSFPIDIWAFASVAVEIITFRPLFAGLNETDQLWHIIKELGNPSIGNRSEEDLGGEWFEGIELAEKLGFVMPSVQPNSIYNIIERLKEDLASIIRQCLLWDPAKRPTAKQLASISYFQGTVVMQPEANQFPLLGRLKLLECNFEPQAAQEFSLTLVRSYLTTMAATALTETAVESQSPTLGLQDDRFYDRWSKSSSEADADISCEEAFGITPLAANSNPFGISHVKADPPVAKAISDVQHRPTLLERFHLRADTSMSSNGILC